MIVPTRNPTKASSQLCPKDFLTAGLSLTESIITMIRKMADKAVTGEENPKHLAIDHVRPVTVAVCPLGIPPYLKKYFGSLFMIIFMV